MNRANRIMVSGIHDMRGTEFFGQRQSRRYDIDSDDRSGAGYPCRHDGAEPDAARPERSKAVSGADLQRVHY